MDLNKLLKTPSRSSLERTGWGNRPCWKASQPLPVLMKLAAPRGTCRSIIPRRRKSVARSWQRPSKRAGCPDYLMAGFSARKASFRWHAIWMPRAAMRRTSCLTRMAKVSCGSLRNAAIDRAFISSTSRNQPCHHRAKLNFSKSLAEYRKGGAARSSWRRMRRS